MKLVFLSSFAHLVLDEAESRVSGGAELQVALLARELAGNGHEVVLIGGDTGQKDGIVLQGVTVRNGGKFHTGNNTEMLGATPRVLRLLREERPNFVGILGWTAWLSVLWAFRKPLGYQLFFICGLDTEVNGEFRRENPLRGGLFEFAMRRCDQRFAMTHLQKQLFEKAGMECGFYRNLVLPRAKPPVEKKTVDFLWVARCRAIKRPMLFVQLARTIPEARFEMICPPEDQRLFEEIQNAAKGLPNLRVLESVPYHQIQTHYDRARIFVNTSEWEGWANSFVQAGQGRCSILSLSVSPDTLFADYGLGVCAEGNLDRFTAKAAEFFHSEHLTLQMGLEAERFVSELHDNERETGRFLEGLTGGAVPSAPREG